MKLRESPIYHERQVFMMCAKHSLNNVLQDEIYTYADFERIAKDLHERYPERSGWLNRNTHKNLFGFGDYDVNVITAALQEHGYDLMWHDNRSDISEADLSGCEGIIVHIQPAWFFRGRGHWFGIKRFDQDITAPIVPATYVGQPRAARSAAESEVHEYDSKTFASGFWNLDSKLVHPEHIGDREHLNAFVKKLSKRNRVHVLFVVPGQTASSASSSI